VWWLHLEKVLHYLSHRWQWQESKESKDALSHIVSPHLGTPREKENLCYGDQFSLFRWGIKSQESLLLGY
jgi:hypothetical protein